jgi:hypothetical protein
VSWLQTRDFAFCLKSRIDSIAASSFPFYSISCVVDEVFLVVEPALESQELVDTAGCHIALLLNLYFTECNSGLFSRQILHLQERKLWEQKSFMVPW